MSGLAGKRVLVTRPRSQDDALVETLVAQGATVVAFPTIAIVPFADQSRLDAALRRLGEYDWVVFTSANAVEVFWERYSLIPIPSSWQGQGRRTLTPDPSPEGGGENVKVAAIGPATAQAVRDRGMQVQVMPEEYVGEALARSLGEVQGKRILLPRAQAAREALAKELTQRGAVVDDIPLYQTVTNQPSDAEWRVLETELDFVTFTSASTVKGFFELLGERADTILNKAVTACIGPITAAALAEYGLEAQVVAGEYTAGGLVQAMVEYTQRGSI